MSGLSVVIAFVNEYPQLNFTIRAIVEELKDRVDFEIIAINNYCDEVSRQGFKEDKGCGSLIAASEGNPWLRVESYSDKLSHWQAKNLGVKLAKHDIFWFPDAHVVPSRDCVFKAFQFYAEKHQELNGTLHLPLTYQVLEWRSLIYSLDADVEKGKYFYTFGPYPSHIPAGEIFEVPVMSTCGCFMHRQVYDKLGGWPEEIGIYGGGEPFVNFSQAVMGMKKHIFAGPPLYHHGDNRGYHWNFDGWVRDELIATYIYGGVDMVWKKVLHMDGSREILSTIAREILSNESIIKHREHIEKNQVMHIEDWVQPWLKNKHVSG